MKTCTSQLFDEMESREVFKENKRGSSSYVHCALLILLDATYKLRGHL